MTADLVAFIRARLDEDEQIARTAIDPKHRGDWAWRKDSRTTVKTRDGIPIGPEARGVEIGPHIARWNPARVLREVEAKRRILDLLDTTEDRSMPAESWEIAKQVRANMAVSYADDLDYRDEWRP